MSTSIYDLQLSRSSCGELANYCSFLILFCAAIR